MRSSASNQNGRPTDMSRSIEPSKIVRYWVEPKCNCFFNRRYTTRIRHQLINFVKNIFYNGRSTAASSNVPSDIFKYNIQWRSPDPLWKITSSGYGGIIWCSGPFRQIANYRLILLVLTRCTSGTPALRRQILRLCRSPEKRQCQLAERTSAPVSRSGFYLLPKESICVEP
jgi:hypothetical protein